MLEIFLILLLITSIVVCCMQYKKITVQYKTILELEKSNAKFVTENDYLNQSIATVKQQAEQSKQDLKIYFENYSNQLLKSKSDSLQQETNKNITSILQPLKEKLGEFQNRVEQTYQAESREMFSLKNEVNKLLVNNSNMLKETANLSQALKGNVKAQGVWGELILESILENSGLRKGQEYITQGTDLKLRDEQNKIQKPDVIINLPDHKHLVIDAKVSLTHYEQYISSQPNGNNINESAESSESLALFVKSIQSHINNLSSKNYQYNDKLITPDFVMLFFPIEGAFSLALQTMPELLMQAWHKKVVIVSPTTLFATLKTIASIWLFDKQNKNAMEIATESGLLYDKLVAFTEDLTKIGQALDKTKESYHHAVSKLSTGRGNIISKTEKIRVLGAKAKKQLAKSWQNDNIMEFIDDNHNDDINSIDSGSADDSNKRELPCD